MRFGTLGLLWAALGAVPPILLGQRFNAYYALFPAVGLALLVGLGLANLRAIVAVAVFAAAAAASLVANGTSAFRWDIEDAQLPVGVSVTTASRLEFESRYVNALRAALRHDPPRRGGAVYLDQPFGFRIMGTSASRGPRVWLGDPDLELKFLSHDRPPATGEPNVLLRYNVEDGSFTRVPESLMRANFEGTDALAAGQWQTARVALERARSQAHSPRYDYERGAIDANLGIALLGLNDTAAARVSLMRAIGTAQGGHGALFGLAELDRRQARLVAARAWLQRALDEFPDDPQALYDRSRFDRALGDRDASDAAWRRLVETHPGYADSVSRANARR
jgi:tetratricopeptide (TPR) repeat protein